VKSAVKVSLRGYAQAFVVLLLAVTAALGATLATASPAEAANFTVTKTADTSDGGCDADCSLREAVIAANTTPGVDMITVPAGTYTLTIQGANEDQSATGDLDISEEVTINGAGSDATTVSAAGLGDRVFDVVNDSDATITGLTASGGNPPADPSRVNAPFGGGISNFGMGELELNEVVVSENTAPTSAAGFAGFGGGITNLGGTLTLTGSTVSGNSADAFGGGIFNRDGVLKLTDSTVSDNVSSSGGGIFNSFSTTVVIHVSSTPLRL